VVGWSKTHSAELKFWLTTLALAWVWIQSDCKYDSSNNTISPHFDFTKAGPQIMVDFKFDSNAIPMGLFYFHICVVQKTLIIKIYNKTVINGGKEHTDNYFTALSQ
jgi:hypothetical protein